MSAAQPPRPSAGMARKGMALKGPPCAVPPRSAGVTEGWFSALPDLPDLRYPRLESRHCRPEATTSDTAAQRCRWQIERQRDILVHESLPLLDRRAFAVLDR